MWTVLDEIECSGGLNRKFLKLDDRTSNICRHEGGVAEGVGFEPTIRFPAYTLSKRAPSATRPPFRGKAGAL